MKKIMNMTMKKNNKYTKLITIKVIITIPERLTKEKPKEERSSIKRLLSINTARNRQTLHYNLKIQLKSYKFKP